ncbi:MAG: hypothetical protein V1838_02760 [Patescibacteria group bacterium]
MPIKPIIKLIEIAEIFITAIIFSVAYDRLLGRTIIIENALGTGLATAAGFTIIILFHNRSEFSGTADLKKRYRALSKPMKIIARLLAVIIVSLMFYLFRQPL